MFSDKKQKVNKLQNKNHNVKYGFLKRSENNSLYISLSSWVKIISNTDKDYNREMNIIHKKIKQLLYDYDDLFYDVEKTIVSLDIRKNGFISNTKSFLTVEITLFTKNEKSFFMPDDHLNNKLLNLIDIIITTNLSNTNDFKFSLKK